MYGPVKNAVMRELRLIPPVAIDLSVNREEERFAISVTVTPEIDMTGHDLVLRIALVEDFSRTVNRPVGPPGEYAADVHPFVVRHMPGGAGGFPISFTAGAFTVETGISTTVISRRLHAWLTEQLPDLALTRAGERILMQREEISAEKLRVVAFVQREQDRRILQGAVWYPEHE
jgi:hypothetical protein